MGPTIMAAAMYLESSGSIMQSHTSYLKNCDAMYMVHKPAVGKTLLVFKVTLRGSSGVVIISAMGFFEVYLRFVL
ncbi:hypothetical protein BCON_0167g00110 [Botryotinia convoluta]|uniref:Uncharacterized protein n=1 Tax=Botryotinia convoluta TaxID=54673 RepID=A0A4Z1HPZ6_9HELO|nr:hypothetical protein BCON_0167g00110 [Botryotinia convoluta]